MKLVEQLPRALSSDPFVGQLMALIEAVNGTVSGHADALEWLADVALTPDAMAQWMTRWLGFDFDESMPPDAVRMVLASAGSSFAQRTTADGLSRLLEGITGGTASVTDEGGVYRRGQTEENSGTVEIRLTQPGPLSREHLVALLDQELPADVAYTVTVAGESVVQNRIERGHPDHSFDCEWSS